MKKMISSRRLLDAYRKGGLGSDEIFDWWMAIWGVRSKIWSEEELSEEVRVALGEGAQAAITAGDPAFFRELADALEAMMLFERKPENAARADIFFGVEELNESRRKFTRRELRKWLNKEMDALVSAEEVDRELERMELAELIPAGKKKPEGK